MTVEQLHQFEDAAKQRLNEKGNYRQQDILLEEAAVGQGPNQISLWHQTQT